MNKHINKKIFLKVINDRQMDQNKNLNSYFYKNWDRTINNGDCGE